MRYASPEAFERALTDRLPRLVQEHGIPSDQVRRMVAFDRILARLNASGNENFVVKGGVALEYRLGDHARVTHDLDLAMDAFPAAQEALRAATDVALDDHCSLRITDEPQDDKPIARGVTAYRWKLRLSIGEKRFSDLTLDVGIEQSSLRTPDNLEAPDFLGFAGIPRTSVRVIPVEYHLAEKLHAYTRTYPGDRPSSRVRDLVDIALIAKHHEIDGPKLVSAVHDVFESRGTQPVPANFPDAPEHWPRSYAVLAAPLGLSADIEDAVRTARTLFEPALSQGLPSLPVYEPASHDIVERQEDLTIGFEQTMRVLGRSADGERVLGRCGGGILSVARDAFAHVPRVDDIVTLARQNDHYIARPKERDRGLER